MSTDDRAVRLRDLHRPGLPLVLPNVWDVAGAHAVQAAGFPAIATASAAVAPALGYTDHEAPHRRRCSPRSPGSPARWTCR